MPDKIYNIADMLKQSKELRLKAETDDERHYFDREIYKWSNQLMSYGINPTDIYTPTFYFNHGL